MNFYEGKRKEAHRFLDSIIDTIIAKNTDYGDSFSITGRVGASTRLMDKATRLFTLSCNNNEPQVKDEAIEDTAMDLFAYALMNILKFYPKLTWNPDDDVEQQIEFCSSFVKEYYGTNWYKEISAIIENLIKKEKKEDCPEKDRK